MQAQLVQQSSKTMSAILKQICRAINNDSPGDRANESNLAARGFGAESLVHLWPGLPGVKKFPDSLRVAGRGVRADADGVGDGAENGRRRGHQRRLAYATRPERPARVI